MFFKALFNTCFSLLVSQKKETCSIIYMSQKFSKSTELIILNVDVKVCFTFEKFLPPYPVIIGEKLTFYIDRLLG